MLVIVYGMARVEMGYNLKTLGQRFQAQRLCLVKGEQSVTVCFPGEISLENSKGVCV